MPSEPGNEHPAMERVADAVEELGLPAQRLERLKTAVAEATMNALEHGSRYRSEVPVVIQVLFRGLNKRESQLTIVVFMLAIAVLITLPDWASSCSSIADSSSTTWKEGAEHDQPTTETGRA